MCACVICTLVCVYTDRLSALLWRDLTASGLPVREKFRRPTSRSPSSTLPHYSSNPSRPTTTRLYLLPLQSSAPLPNNQSASTYQGCMGGNERLRDVLVEMRAFMYVFALSRVCVCLLCPPLPLQRPIHFGVGFLSTFSDRNPLLAPSYKFVKACTFWYDPYIFYCPIHFNIVALSTSFDCNPLSASLYKYVQACTFLYDPYIFLPSHSF